MKVYLGADHGGLKLKNEVAKWLKDWHIPAEDLGAHEFDSDDDYPDYAWPVAMKVGSDSHSMGILVCRSGQGVCIAANKARHVRAAVAWNDAAHAARNDDDANILCLPADYLTLENAKAIVHMFLNTPFNESEPRFKRRADKIKKIDHNL